MNRYILIIAIQFIAIYALGQAIHIKQLNSEELRSTLRSGEITLIDVRTPGEFANGHIADAGQLNYYALDFKRKLLLLPREQPVYLYCNTGYRSQRAAEILADNGYKQVHNLEHGIMEWDLYNLPVVVEPDARPDAENKMESDEYYALIQSGKPVFIDFYAPWCGPCRTMMPMIDSLKTKYKGQITIVKINADASKKLVKELRIGSVPYLVLYVKNKIRYSHNGIISREELSDVLQKSIP
jgi:thioredoxin 1